MTTRRQSLKLLAVASAAPILPTVAEDARQMPDLSVNDPIATALGYQPDAQDVDTTRFPKRAGAAGATQFCDNCSLYRATGGAKGTCSAIPGKLVEGRGWCNAWIPVQS